MKPFVVALAVFAGSAAATAFADRPQRGVGVAAAIGIAHSSVRSRVDADYGNRTSMAVGLRVNHQVSRGFAFIWGLQVAQFGFSGGPEGLVLEPDAVASDPCAGDGMGDDCEGDVDTALNMMSVQLGARHQFRDGLFMAAGFELNFLMGARSKSATMDEVVDSTRHFRYRSPYLSQRLAVGYRFISALSVELALHQPVMSWGNGDVGLGSKFVDGTAGILSLVVGSR